MGYNNKELSILFTDDDHIAAMNFQYLGKKGPTNVLAFPMHEDSEVSSVMLGDVVISVETAWRESQELGEPPAVTVERLLIHGLLHLVGYDHELSQIEEDRMEKEEKRLIKLLEEV